ncbi:unnamed protein product [Trichobilharzia regenti]|uniref:GATA zinc finger domain-containing protein 14-like n=1 Tax=Trichobilharzia regenti TaxID=157069 RepID=A0A183VNL4_TRIRE|nr:unnamed protein product [Trichobilharzia regenti]VDP97949.1 unnamed protein product [Trichobilharzia regenti]
MNSINILFITILLFVYFSGEFDAQRGNGGAARGQTYTSFGHHYDADEGFDIEDDKLTDDNDRDFSNLHDGEKSFDDGKDDDKDDNDSKSNDSDDSFQGGTFDYYADNEYDYYHGKHNNNNNNNNNNKVHSENKKDNTNPQEGKNKNEAHGSVNAHPHQQYDYYNDYDIYEDFHDNHNYYKPYEPDGRHPNYTQPHDNNEEKPHKETEEDIYRRHEYILRNWHDIHYGDAYGYASYHPRKYNNKYYDYRGQDGRYSPNNKHDNGHYPRSNDNHR